MRRIETTATIDAPPERVWEVLTDLDAMDEWNPFIVEAQGKPAVAERLRIRVAPPGKRPATFTPVVLTADRPRELRWRGTLPIPGLFAGEHYFVLEPTGTGTRLRHGETFAGLLVPLMGGMLKATAEGFERMNAALKDRVENG